jgi:hypothetical protein
MTRAERTKIEKFHDRALLSALANPTIADGNTLDMQVAIERVFIYAAHVTERRFKVRLETPEAPEL